MDSNWLKLKNGDHAGLEGLYKEHAEAMYSYGYSLCRDADKVKDAIHDVFLTCWNQRTTITTPDSEKAYLLISLKRSLFQKSALSSKTVSMDDEGNSAEPIEIDFLSRLFENTDKEEAIRKLEQAMASLTDRQKEIIQLKYFQKLKYEEIESILDMNYQSARNLLNRSIQALKKGMQIILILWK